MESMPTGAASNKAKFEAELREVTRVVMAIDGADLDLTVRLCWGLWNLFFTAGSAAGEPLTLRSLTRMMECAYKIRCRCPSLSFSGV